MKTIQNSKYFKPAIITLLVLLMLFIGYLLFGYGSIKISNNSDNTAVFIDGSFVGENKEKIKTRPGTHSILISSPEYEISQKINVSLLRSKTIDAKSVKRDFVKTAAEALSTSETVKLYYDKMVDKNLYAGQVFVGGTGKRNFLVMEFSSGRWNILYRGAGFDDDYVKSVPSSVKSYFNQIGGSEVYGD